ncbi:hypothetical protein [Acinetobacter sp. Leaf130]|uniref:hypothetical protein n=1 Tax=Acinetobacter sp. Leaf130 TaxID=1736269 RepID=UPI0006F6C36A|nr:hypothetical protein [Acinetobacter sp. Leaf130]KQQ77923.1 hypothetical protein ASF86_07070 [Acinetobacter sp. Leaf130]
MQTNLSNQIAKYNLPDFLVGDVVVMVGEDDYHNLFEVVGRSKRLIHLKGIDSLFYGRLNFQIRTATVAELNAKRRLISAEQALAEVS